MLISILIIRYLYLRSILQLDNSAKVKLLEQESQEITQKWVNLLFMKLPNQNNTKNRNNTENESDIERTQTHSFGLWQIFRLNLNEILSKPKIKSKETLEKEHQQMKQKIILERKKAKKKRIKRYSAENFSEHKRNLFKFVLYLVYCILFVIIILMQFKITESYEPQYLSSVMTRKEFIVSNYYFVYVYNNRRMLQASPTDPNADNTTDPTTDDTGGSTSDSSSNTLKKNMTLTYFNIYGVYTIDQFARQILYPSIFGTPNHAVWYQNFAIGDPTIYFGVKRAKYHENGDSKTNSVFPSYVDGKTYTLYKKMGSEIDDDDVTLKNGTVVTLTPEKSGSTMSDVGGYIVDFSRNTSYLSPPDYLHESTLVSPNWANIYYTFIFYSRNTGHFYANILSFTNTPAGEVIPTAQTFDIRMYYDSSLEYFRFFLEIVYTMIF